MEDSAAPKWGSAGTGVRVGTVGSSSGQRVLAVLEEGVLGKGGRGAGAVSPCPSLRSGVWGAGEGRINLKLPLLQVTMCFPSTMSLIFGLLACLFLETPSELKGEAGESGWLSFRGLLP